MVKMRRAATSLCLAVAAILVVYANACGQATSDLVVVKFDMQKYDREIISHLFVRNTGNKTAYSVAWDYVLSDLSTGKDVARIQFQRKELIAPNKTIKLSSVILRRSETPANQAAIKDYKPHHYRDRVALALVEWQFLGTGPLQ